MGDPLPYLANPLQLFQLIHPLGRGSYGSVYKARNLSTSEIVAIKVIALSFKDEMEAIQREIQMLRDCKHPNVVKYYVRFNSHEGVRCGGTSVTRHDGALTPPWSPHCRSPPAPRTAQPHSPCAAIPAVESSPSLSTVRPPTPSFPFLAPFPFSSTAGKLSHLGGALDCDGILRRGVDQRHHARHRRWTQRRSHQLRLPRDALRARVLALDRQGATAAERWVQATGAVLFVELTEGARRRGFLSTCLHPLTIRGAGGVSWRVGSGPAWIMPLSP